MTRTLREILDEIREDHGRLTPAVVVDVARDPAHPLHGRFTWDNDEAADRHRINEARNLIRRCRVVYRPGTGTSSPGRIRAYHSMPDPEGRSYVPVKQIAEDPLARKILLAQMERDWLALKRRYGHFAEFVELVRGDVGGEAA